MLQEFFKEVDDSGAGKLSVSRLVYFLSFFPAAYHVVITGQDMSSFIAAYTAGYLGSKHGGALCDAIGNKNNANTPDQSIK